MDQKVLQRLLISLVCLFLVASAVEVRVLHSEHFIGILYGAAGVGLFTILTGVLSLIQKEGTQDD